ncbi:MAG: PIG-L family deacetylase [Thiotrichaceae bacterium]|nr:PIG-L family deacetylase [Thiotrichaceae bacterium]
MESSFIPYTPTTSLPTGNVLILAPHADDEVFGCAGAIMQHLAQGNSVSVIIITDGRAAISHPDKQSMLHYIETRQQESDKAAKILGYENLEFWEIVDRTLEHCEDFIQRLVNVFKVKAITQVYAPSVMEIHPDHYALAMSAVEAVRRCGETVSLAMYEIGVPLHPNILLDITAFFKRKQEAIACFVSQLSLQDYSQKLLCLNSYRTYSLPEHVIAAEAYYVLNGAELHAEPLLMFGQTRQTTVLQETNKKLTIAQQELSLVYNSRSWFLTSLLRRLLRRIH